MEANILSMQQIADEIVEEIVNGCLLTPIRGFFSECEKPLGLVRPVGFFDDEIKDAEHIEMKELEGHSPNELLLCFVFHHSDSDFYPKNDDIYYNSGALSDRRLHKEQILDDSDLADFYGGC